MLLHQHRKEFIMIRSMTGYGAAEDIVNGYNIRVEIKSVNHRYFEYSARVPRSCGFLEEKLKKLLTETLSRGKVDVGVSIQAVEEVDESININKDIARGYVDALRSIKDELGLEDDLKLSSLSKFPDVFTIVRNSTDEEQMWNNVKTVEDKAVASFVSMRETEGEKMKADVLEKTVNFEKMLSAVEERAPQRVDEYREKLYAKMKEILEDKQIDDARIVQEAAIYADHVAIDEETVRLHSHISQLRKIVNLDEPVGRKLDFLIQEFNRETNTIGSKCTDVEISQIVVDMKSEIEKIREQIQNIE